MLLSIGRSAGRELRQSASNQRVMLVVTPFCSPSCAYPAPAYLARYLREQGVTVQQADLNLALMLKMFSRAGFTRIFDAAERAAPSPSENGARHHRAARTLSSTIETVIRF